MKTDCFSRDPVLAKAHFQIYQILMFNPWSVFRNLLTIVQLKLVIKKKRRRKKMQQCLLKQRPLFSLRYVVKVCAILFKAFNANFDVGNLSLTFELK